MADEASEDRQSEDEANSLDKAFMELAEDSAAADDEQEDEQSSEAEGEPAEGGAQADESEGDKPKDDESEEADEQDEADDEPERDSDIAADMAGLSHEDVRNSPAFKGVMTDLQKEREKNKALQKQIDAGADEFEFDDEELLDDEEDADADKPKPKAESATDKRLAAIEKRLNASEAVENRQSFQQGLDGLVAAQAAGEIPQGVNTDKVMRQAIELAKENEPESLKLLQKPNGVRKFFEYARQAYDEIGSAVNDAQTAADEQEEERIVTGQSTETTEIEDFANVLNSG